MTRRPRDEAAAERLGRVYDRFAGVMYRYALMILADPAAAADAVQQVFVSAMGRGTLHVDTEERYFMRAVRNACFSAIRMRRPTLSIDQAPWLESVQSGGESHDERLAIEQAMRGLSPEQREVVHLKVFEGWTFREIATMQDESINTVASRYRYALDHLRVRLQ